MWHNTHKKANVRTIKRQATRLWVVLLSIYILTMAAVPCHCSERASVRACTPVHTETSYIESHHHGCGEGGVGEWQCTPFCLCASAHHASFFMPTFLLHMQAPTSGSEKVAIYVQRQGVSCPSFVWRPPRIS